MQEILFFTCNAVLPIILLILLGYATKRANLFSENFYSQLNRLCFKICLPALLFCNIYNVTDVTAILNDWKVALFAITSISILFFAGLIFVILIIKQQNQKGVVLQCIFRSNFAIIGIPLVAFLTNNSQEQLATASVLAAVSIPFFNIYATIALSVFSEKKIVNDKKSIAKIIKRIATNPLVLGVCLGIIALIIRQILPKGTNGQPVFSIREQLPFLFSALQMIANAASPIALFALGGTFTFSAAKRLKWQIIFATAIRTLLAPTVCLLAAYATGFRTDEFPSLIALFGTPVAVSSVPMSAEMEGDTELAAQLVVWTSLVSTLTLFASISICATVNLLNL